MPVGSGVPYNEHVANGTVTVFAFGFTLLDSGDLVVTVDGVTKTLTTDYTINGLGNVAGGEVVFVVAPVASAAVVLERIIELERTTDYQALGNFNADTVDDDFDRLWMVVQGLDVGIGRALRVPETAIIAELPAAAVRANKLLAFNSVGDPNVLVPVSGSAADVLIQLANTESASLNDALIGVKSTLTGGAARTQHDKNADVIGVFDFLTPTEIADVKAGTAAVDVTAGVQAALTAAAGKALYFPSGNYRVVSGLTVPLRTRLVGDGPTNTQIYYRPTVATVNQLFDFDNVDNIHIENIGLVFLSGGGGQQSSAVLCQGDGGAVTEILLHRVHVTGFQQYGLRLNTSAYYVSLTQCRFLDCTNEVANGGTGAGNAVAVSFGSPVNAVRLHECRFASNDQAIISDTADKYSLGIFGCYFELNGRAGGVAEVDTINLYGWKAVAFVGNYCEANLTGTAAADSFLRLQACGAVHIAGNLFAGALGGVPKSKNLIGISNNCIGVTIENNEFQDPITKMVYVADGNSLARLSRNRYLIADVAQTTYAAIMGYMTASLVELDVGHIAAVNTGVIAAAGNYQVNLTVVGIDITRNIAVIMTPLGATAADWIFCAAPIAADTVRFMAYNIKGANNTFNGNVVIRMLKDG